VVEPDSPWIDGTVDQSDEHMRLCFGEVSTPVALVAPAGDRYLVEFLLDPAEAEAAEAVREARRELDLYLMQSKEPDPWAYAVYHCSTASNLYSSIHWEHVAPKS
jgi:hypothetical protein